MLRIAAGLLALLVSSAAFGQGTVLQGGSWTAGRAPMYVGTGSGQAVVQDSGPAGGGTTGLGLKELLLTARGTGTPPFVAQGTGPGGTNFCNYDAPTTNATGYHYICMSPNATVAGVTGSIITAGSGGATSAVPLYLCSNGTCVTPSGTIAGLTVGTTTIAGGGNGGVLYDNSGILGEVAAPSVALRMMQSGASAAPSYSTSTWPATTTINQILYSSAANTVSGLATQASSILVTDGSGVPSLSTTAPSGINFPLTVGTTTIASGTSLGMLYNNAGVLGNTASLANAVLVTNASSVPAFSTSIPSGVVGNALGWYIVGSAEYPTAASAITAANTAGGGIVYFPCKPPINSTILLGSGAIGLDMRNMRNVRLIGGASLNSGGSICTYLSYTGTGTAIDISGSTGTEIAGLEIWGQSADYVIRASGATQAAYARIHDNTIFGKTTATGIGISFDNIIVSSVTSNVINAYIGMRGIDSVGATHTSNVIQIEKNSFTSGNTIHLQNATLWSVDKNTFTGSVSGVAYGQSAGVAGCSIINFSNNDFDDPQAGTLLINTDCKQVNSWGNVFSTMAGGTVFTLTAGTDAVLKSDGDYYNLSGTGININTGNCAQLINPRLHALVSPAIAGTQGCTQTNLIYQNSQQSGIHYGNLNTASPPTAVTGTMLQLSQADSVSTRLGMYAFGTANAGVLDMYKSRGTKAAPTAAQTGDALAAWIGTGYGATGYGAASGAIQMSAAENFTDTAKSSYWGIFTATTGATTSVERMRVGQGVAIPASVTGGDKGAGTINATTIYQNNVALGALATVTPGTGVATALGVNVGTAGSFVVNGGALGSPSSAGTLPAHTLGGTISGGGNQINNVIIGTSTPLAGSFTQLGATTQMLVGNQSATDTILTVNANNGTPDTDSFGTNIAHFICPDTTLCGIFMDSYGTSASQNFLASRMAGGTRASKTALTAGAGFSFFAQGWDTAAYGSMGAIDILANGTQSPTDHAGYVQIRTVPTGSTTLTFSARFHPSGGLSIGTSSDPGTGMIYTNAATFMHRTKTSWTNGAAAGAGTITNAPSAGNPTKWIPVDDNGTTRYIPAW